MDNIGPLSRKLFTLPMRDGITLTDQTDVLHFVGRFVYCELTHNTTQHILGRCYSCTAGLQVAYITPACRCHELNNMWRNITLHLCHNPLDECIWWDGRPLHFSEARSADGSILPVFQSWSDSQHGRARLNGRLHASLSLPLLYSSSLALSSCPWRHFVFLPIYPLHRLPCSILLPLTLLLFLSDSSGAPLGGN